jgi:hypothetical protein
MKYSIHLSLISHLRKEDSVILCKAAQLHTQGRCGVFGEFNREERIICKGLWPPRSLDINPCDFYLWGKLKSVVYAKNPHDLEALKQNIRASIYNT